MTDKRYDPDDSVAEGYRYCLGKCDDVTPHTEEELDDEDNRVQVTCEKCGNTARSLRMEIDLFV